MRVINNYGTTLMDYLNSSKSIQEVLDRGATGSKLSAAAQRTLEKHGITIGSGQRSSSSGSDITAYKKVNDVTEELRDTALLLQDTSGDSLFEQAKQDNDRTGVTEAVERFIEQYNGMLDAMDDIGGDENSQYAKELSALTQGSLELLEAVGISQDKKGRLSIDNEKFAAAGLDDIQKAFAGDKGYADQVAKKSIYITANALQAMYGSLTAGYTKQAGYTGETFTDETKYNFLKSI